MKPWLCFEQPRGFGLVLQGCALLCSLGFRGCVPSVRPRAGKCPGAGTWLGKLGTQKPLCSHAASQLRVLRPLLHPSALHSQGEGDLLP